MNGWTYYAVFQTPTSTADRPQTILRHRAGTPRMDAEILASTASGWRQSELLARVFVGKSSEIDLAEVSRERAAEVARRWVEEGLMGQIPPDLAPQS